MAANEAYGKAVANQDVAAVVALYTPDAILLPPDSPVAQGSDAIRYSVYISDVAHPEHETCKLHGGHGKDWIGRYGKIVSSHR